MLSFSCLTSSRSPHNDAHQIPLVLFYYHPIVHKKIPHTFDSHDKNLQIDGLEGLADLCCWGFIWCYFRRNM